MLISFTTWTARCWHISWPFWRCILLVTHTIVAYRSIAISCTSMSESTPDGTNFPHLKPDDQPVVALSFSCPDRLTYLSYAINTQMPWLLGYYVLTSSKIDLASLWMMLTYDACAVVSVVSPLCGWNLIFLRSNPNFLFKSIYFGSGNPDVLWSIPITRQRHVESRWICCAICRTFPSGLAFDDGLLRCALRRSVARNGLVLMGKDTQAIPSMAVQRTWWLWINTY